jgi:hypothetical protein
MNSGLASLPKPESQPLFDRAVESCRRAKAGLATGVNTSEQILRSVREAGQFLDQVERQPGSSGGQTKLQAVTEEAGIRRDTAWRWRLVGRVPDGEFEAYVDKKKAEKLLITIDGLIHKRTARGRDDRYLHHLAVLAEKFGTKRGQATVKAAVQLAYEAVLNERCER